LLSSCTSDGAGDEQNFDQARGGVMGKADLSANTEQWSHELELRIRAALKEIRYGTVSLVIQDGKVIQIDKSEKIRLK
jgi:hypothetical protein